MVIAVLDMTAPRGHEADTVAALRACFDAASAQPGCLGGGVFCEVGAWNRAVYIETWSESAQLEAHVRSPEYGRLLAIMETSAEPPALTFNFVSETRELPWVEELRLGGRRGQ